LFDQLAEAGECGVDHLAALRSEAVGVVFGADPCFPKSQRSVAASVRLANGHNIPEWQDTNLCSSFRLDRLFRFAYMNFPGHQLG
jgi:hypothetical protein